MVKIRVIIKQNANVLTIYVTLFKNVINILPTIYQNKSKMPGRDRKCLVHSYKVASYINYLQAI